MEYRAVSKRCAVDFKSLALPINQNEAISLLIDKGFKVLDVDILTIAKSCVGKSIYRRGARLHEAPDVVDCSSLIKWLYAQRGIWLPRRSIQQRECGENIPLHGIIPGDVVFVSGWRNYYIDNPRNGVGHCGIATEDGTVIHAANKKVGVVETYLENFIGKTSFRGVRRYLPPREIVTLEIPQSRDVEIEDDIKWIVLQSI